MSMYLFDEQPILANKTLAREIGLNEALVLQQINYWIEINKRAGNNYFDGKYWTYNSIRAWHENDFDYMSIDTVKRTFSKLEKMGYLLVGNFNKDPRDKTKWYTINDEKLEELYFEMREKKSKQEREILEKITNNALPNALVQNAPMDKGKLPQCKDADCTNALDENALMQYGKMHQPLPEITTKNTTEITSDISSNTSIYPSFYDIVDESLEDGMVDGHKKIKSYDSCLEELRESTGYNDHYRIGNKDIARNYDEIIKVLADVMVLNPDDTVTINQVKLPAYIVQERFRSINKKLIVTLNKREMDSIIREIFADYPDNLSHYETLFLTQGNMGEIFGNTDLIESHGGIGGGQEYEASADVQKKIVDAAFITPSPGPGWCAMWVSQVYQNAGLGYIGGNANDMYRNHTFTSDRSKLEVGMLVAVESSSSGGQAGLIYGHVGIYIGDGKVIDNIGRVRVTTLDDWIATFCQHSPVGFGFPPSVQK